MYNETHVADKGFILGLPTGIKQNGCLYKFIEASMMIYQLFTSEDILQKTYRPILPQSFAAGPKPCSHPDSLRLHRQNRAAAHLHFDGMRNIVACRTDEYRIVAVMHTKFIDYKTELTNAFARVFQKFM